MMIFVLQFAPLAMLVFLFGVLLTPLALGRRGPTTLRRLLVETSLGGMCGFCAFAVFRGGLISLSDRLATFLGKLGSPWAASDWWINYFCAGFILTGMLTGGAIGWWLTRAKTK